MEISGTSATLGATGHTMTCTLLVDPGTTILQYQWRIGGSIVQEFSEETNLFVISLVSVSDARSDYLCEVMAFSTTYTGSASLHVASECS